MPLPVEPTIPREEFMGIDILISFNTAFVDFGYVKLIFFSSILLLKDVKDFSWLIFFFFKDFISLYNSSSDD